MIGIYKIQNKLNGKIYVGQSVDIERRWKEHISDAKNENKLRNYNMTIHKAFRKYGIENFTFEVLELCEKEELDNREKYWIITLDTLNKEKGYNIASGGQECIPLKGENHSQAKLTQSEVDEIKTLLKENKSTSYIVDHINNKVSRGMILLINRGANWYDPKESYPLRKEEVSFSGENNPNAQVNEEIVMELRILYSQGKTLKELCEYAWQNWGIKERTARSIICGESWKSLPIWKNRLQEWI
jgi:group I intron endonuclease